MKVDEVISVGILAQLWVNTKTNQKFLKRLNGKNILIVNEKEHRICGLITLQDTPDEYTETVVYTKQGDRA